MAKKQHKGKRVSQQPQNETTAVDSADWAARRAELVDDGDEEGTRLFDEMLPKLKPQPFARAKGNRDGHMVEGDVRTLCAADLLDWLLRRSGARKLLAELRPDLETAATTPTGLCSRWQRLAAWVSRFERRNNEGRDVVALGRIAGLGKRAGLESPGHAWAEAFREATAALLPLLLSKKIDDAPVHRLQQDLDDVLNGKALDIVGHVRNVDVLVRSAAARETRQARSSMNTMKPGLSKKAIAALMVLPRSDADPIDTLAGIAIKMVGAGKSEATASRAIKELRKEKFAAPAFYKLTPKGDEEQARNKAKGTTS